MTLSRFILAFLFISAVVTVVSQEVYTPTLKEDIVTEPQM